MQQNIAQNNKEKFDQSQLVSQLQQTEPTIQVSHFQPKFIHHLNTHNPSIQNKNNPRRILQTISRELQKLRMPTRELENYIPENVSMRSFLDCYVDGRKKHKLRRRKRKSFGYKIIQGSIHLGVVHGQAILEFSCSGCVFKGRVEYGEIRQGDLSYPDGTKYSGMFVNSLPNGPGKLLFPNGTQYITTFKNGEAAGQAQITYENGDMYKGPIAKLKKHGLGKMFFKNGDKYIGDFTHGEITGKGVYYVDSRPVAAGIWHNGELILEKQLSGAGDLVAERGY